MIEPIPFTSNQQSGYDVLSGASPAAINVVVDGAGSVRRRPCIAAHAVTAAISSNPVIGLFSTSTGKLFAATGDLPGEVRLYRISSTGAVDLTSTTQRRFTAESRIVWAETEAAVLLGTGRAIQRVLLQSDDVGPLGGDPPYASHVIAQGSRLLANDTLVDRTKIQYSAPNQNATSLLGHEQWGAQVTAIGRSGFFTAEARPDSIVALAENSNEVFAFGVNNTQAFAPDGTLIYASVSAREFGCAAPYSVIKDDQSFAWLDDRRRIVHSDGRSVRVLSDPIKKTLDDMSRVDDAFGYRMLVGPVDALVWTFPSDGRTLMYQRGGGWSLMMGWDDSANNWARFPVNAHTQVSGTNQNIVGLTTGKLGELSIDARDDLGDRVPASVTTGFIDRGSDVRKRHIATRLVLRRGGTSMTREPIGSLQWRDGEGSWRSPIPVGFGVAGDREIVVTLRSLGVYRRRQWKFSFHELSEDFLLAGASEEFETLGS